MTSATEVLRRMLDERGVEHYDGIESTLWLRDEHGYRASADELTSGRMSVHIWCDTPEQAIAATLGAADAKPTQAESSGTCKPREVRSRFSKTQEYVTYHCECGHELGGYMTAELPFPHTYNEDELPNYCPNCGRRIEQ